MSEEPEIAALASAGALKDPASGAQERPEGACANCGAEFTGRFCPECGQRASDFHRPVFTMLGEILVDTFSLDGRLARTLPALLFRPGQITRSYLEGHRARYVPPFRMFLVSSLVFFSVLFLIGDRQDWGGGWKVEPGEESGQLNLGINIGEDDDTAVDSADVTDLVTEDGTLDRERLKELILSEAEFETEAEREVALEAVGTASDQFNKLYQQRQLFIATLKEWAPRLSLLMFPIFAVFLTVLYAWRRRIFVYDHLVTSLHFQSFVYLGGTVFMLLGFVIGGWAGLGFMLLAFVYLYRLLRKTYGTGRIMSVLRTSVLFFGSMIAMTALVATLAVIGFLQVWS